MARGQVLGSSIHPTRRDFMRAAGCAAIAGTSIVSTIRAAVRDDLYTTISRPRSSYKAAVCIFLYGGNDANNLIVPTDSRYRDYAAGRTNLALPLATLLPLNVLNTTGETYGLHPACSRLAQLFNTGQLAILTNVGTLAGPGLFSHTNQQEQWAGFVPGYSPAAVLQPTDEPIRELAQRLSCDTGVSPVLVPFTRAGRPCHDRSLSDDHSRTDSQSVVIASDWKTPFQHNNLCRQLSRIASQIASRTSGNRTRDTFFVSLGGYDLHAAQTTSGDPTTGAHANLLTELSEGMYAFQQAMQQLGLADNVVTFTMSEFGRTLASNGLGSDHGWGSHHLIMGGRNLIHGQKIHGTFPSLQLNGPDDAGAGRWIPTTSVAQYAATIARWLGTSASDLPSQFPNIGRFAASELGFMNFGT